LYPFKETEDVSVDEPISDKDENVEWKEQLPREAQKEIEEVLHREVLRKTKGK
jgi:hypothetical protein